MDHQGGQHELPLISLAFGVHLRDGGCLTRAAACERVAVSSRAVDVSHCAVVVCRGSGFRSVRLGLSAFLPIVGGPPVSSAVLSMCAHRASGCRLPAADDNGNG